MATTQYIRYPNNTGGGGGVTSINTLTGDVILAPGTGISITPSGNTLTIATTGAAFTPGNLTDVGTDGITITGGTNAVNGSGTSIAQHVADATHNGYLSSADWSTFNNKQPAGNYALTDLSNLAALTAVNNSITPATSFSIDLGSTTTQWRRLYIDGIRSSSGVEAISVASRFLLDSGGALMLDFSTSASGLNINTHQIHNVVDPTSAQDAATKNYVDTNTGNAANKSLSNLTSPTAINQSLIPNADDTFDLGTDAARWRDSYFSGTVNSSRFDARNASHSTVLSFSGTAQGLPSGGFAALSFWNVNTPSGTPQTVDLGFFTSSGSGTSSGNVRIETGNNSGGNSGDIRLQTGTASGTRGIVSLNGASIDVNTTQIHNLVDPSTAQDAATKNYVDTAISAGAFANQTLSNLTAPTAINQRLLPDSSGTRDLGNNTLLWRDLYISNLKDSTAVATIAATSRQLKNTAGGTMLDWSSNSAGIDVNTHFIINVVDPVNPQDAATKAYVDSSSGTAITALTGDVTATGPGSAAATLATVNANVGSFGSSTSIPNFTVNAKGLITAAGGNVVIAPAGTLTGTTLNSTVVTSSLTSLGVQSVALNMGSHLINAVTDPVSAQDAATKAYVDNVAAGINPAVAVQAATTSASDTSGFTYNNGVGGIGATLTGIVNTPVVIDGFTFTTLGQRLLVKNDTQSPSGAFNGVYYVTQVQTVLLAPILTRALDYDQPSDINNTGAIPVINGTVNGTTQWVLTSLVNTVGTDPLTFALFTRNPADYLLKANNLSDVANANTSFNNISPMTTAGDIIYENATPAAARLPVGTNGQYLTVATGLPAWTSVAPGSVQIATIQDQKAAGTDGGTFTAGAWRTRDLNTLNDPTGFVTSLSGNQFVLESGIYLINAQAPCADVGQNQARLFDITNSAAVILGSVSYCVNTAQNATDHSFLMGIITVTGTTTFEIQHQCVTTFGGAGFGLDVGSFWTPTNNNVYTSAIITKIS